MNLQKTEPYLRGFLSNQKGSAATVKDYTNSIREFLGYLEAHTSIRSFNSVTVEVFNSYQQWLIELGRTPTTINKKKSAVKKFFEYLYDKGEVGREYRQFKGVKTSGHKRLQPCPDIDRVKALMYQIPRDNVKDLQDYLLLFIMANTGLRREEVIHLKPSNLKLSRHGEYVIKVTGKGNKPRTILISEAVYHGILDTHEKIIELRQQRTTYLISSVSNNFNPHTPVNRGTVNDRIKAISEDYGVEDLTPHGMRRFYATNLFLKGTSLETISLRMGHSSTETTREYLHEEIISTKRKDEELPAVGA